MADWQIESKAKKIIRLEISVLGEGLDL